MEGANHQLNVSPTLTVGCGGVGDKLSDHQGVSSEVPIAAVWCWVLPVEDDGSGIDGSASGIQWGAGWNCRHKIHD